MDVGPFCFTQLQFGAVEVVFRDVVSCCRGTCSENKLAKETPAIGDKEVAAELAIALLVMFTVFAQFEDFLNTISKGFVRDPDKLKRLKAATANYT